MENLGLIDWRMVAFAGLWIGGIAVVLTTLGFADYRRQMETGLGLRAVLRRPSYQVPINGGLALFCASMIDSARALWESLLWGALALAFAYFAWSSWRAWKAQSEGRSESGRNQ